MREGYLVTFHKIKKQKLNITRYISEYRLILWLSILDNFVTMSPSLISFVKYSIKHNHQHESQHCKSYYLLVLLGRSHYDLLVIVTIALHVVNLAERKKKN